MNSKLSISAKRTNYILVLQMLICFFLLISQSIFAKSGKLTRFERFSIEEGLSQATVRSIYQDKKGFLWFATHDGLNRYDGYEFKIYRHNNEDLKSLSDNTIFAIYEDRSGTLWIGTTNGGLNKFDPSTEQFTRFRHDRTNSNSLSNDFVMSITEDHQGFLWIGTQGGLNKFDPSTEHFVHYRNNKDDPNSLSDDNVWTIYEDKKNNLWIGTEGGLDKLNPDKNNFIHFNAKDASKNNLRDNRIRSIDEGQSGILWIGSYGGGLKKLDTSTEEFTHFRHDKKDPDSLSHDHIWTVYVDSKDSIWIGTYGGGLNKLDPVTGKFIRFNHDKTNLTSLSAKNVLSIYEDRGGILWIGTHGGGLNKLEPSTTNFNHFSRDENDLHSLSDKRVWAIHKNKKEEVWIGTSGGLNKYDPITEKFSHFLHDENNPNSLSTNNVLAVFEDGNGIVWVGTHDGGLNKYDPKTNKFKRYQHDESNQQSISSNTILDIYQDDQGIFWFGTSKGLNKFDPISERFSHFKHDDNDITTLSNNVIWTICPDKAGNLWLGTNGGGINIFDPITEKFTLLRHDFNDANSLSDDRVWAIYEDKKGNIWAGTAGRGLNKFIPETNDFKHYTEKQGLINDSIYGVVEDDSGNLWLSTNKGLSKFDPVSEIFKDYTINDGLQSNEFNIGASSRSQDGELFFGGINGFNRFFPESITENKQAPKVVISDFLLFNQSVKLKSEDANSPLSVSITESKALILNYEQSIFSFEFTALDFSDPQNNLYAYMLEGFDHDWIKTDAHKRFATYMRLSAGDYTFRVKGSNQNGVWNETGTSIQITILPPPWKTWWAYMLYTLAVLSIIAKYSHSQRTEQKRLEALVKDRTKELVKLTTAVEQSPASVMITNLNGSIEYVNPKFSSVTGYTEEEATGKNALFIVSQQHQPERSDELWKTLDAGQEWQGEFLNQKKDGTLFWESSLFSPIYGDDGTITHYLAVKEDITERKVMEEQLKKAKDAAEVATRTKSDFLANMSHEIRTPMNAIIGMSHLALQTDLNRKQKDYVNKINTAANSLLGIINDILDFSKIEAGKMSMEAVPFSLGDTLNELTQLVMIKIQEQGIELLIDISKDVPDNLIGDSLRLRQILINLANNAVKFTNDGEIIIRIEQKERHKNQVTLQFSVIDSGIGMSEEQMSKLFQSFSQADTSITRKYGGTGLGLTISKTLTEMMGGNIWLKSKEGEGTTFYFTANFGLSNDIVLPHVQPKVDLRGLPVLIVDDSPSAREIMQHLAQSLTFDTHVVATGEEAMQSILHADQQGSPFSVVFMDWKMPGMSGIDACYHIKSDLKLSTPPKVVMVTAYNKDDMLRQLEGNKPDALLSKPVVASSLLNTTMMVMGYEKNQIIKRRNDIELEAVASIRGARILLVDDNEVNQQVGAELLELAQMVVTTADDGKSAVDKVKEEDFDLVLMDIQMPIMDGYIATKEIRKNPKYKTLPIIAMTANAMSTDRDKCLKAGMNEHIAKPIDPNLLYRMLVQWIKPEKREIPLTSALSQSPNIDEENKAITALTLALPEFEVEQAVIGIGGSLKAYYKVLNKVVMAESDAMERLQNSLDNDDHEASIRIAHSLKGVAGSIGAINLQLIASDLEAVLINEYGSDEQHRLLTQAKKVLNETMVMIQHALTTEEEKPLENNDINQNKATLDSTPLSHVAVSHSTPNTMLNAEIIDALKKLLVFIDNCDAMSEEAVETLLEKIDEQEICEQLTRLQRYLAKYDFDSATNVLNTLLDKYGDASVHR